VTGTPGRAGSFGRFLLAAVLVAGCAAQNSPPDIKTIRVGYPSVADFQDLASLMALDELARGGYTVVTTFYAQSDLAVEALASGQADVGFGNTRAHWAAIAQGAEIRTIMEQVANGWSLVSRTEIAECTDLEGRRLAVGSEGSVAKAMTEAWMLETCPEVLPEVLIIPGSENRAAALLSGEIDATTAEPADVVHLMAGASDRFHVLVDFAALLPDLVTTGVNVNTEFAQENPQAVRALVLALLDTHRRIAADPGLLTTAAVARLGLDEALLPAILEAHMRLRAWDPNGGLTRDAAEYSLEFFTSSGSLDPGPSVDQIADLSFLDAALAEVGRVGAVP
jgi:NitT/TauT family transport system substrate-binding protein